MRLKTKKLTSTLSEDIRKLLHLSRTRLKKQINYFSLGDRALVLGVPFCMEEGRQMRVFAYDMHATSSVDCEFEIYFKNLLFTAYSKKYL